MRIVVNDIAASKGGALTILRQFYDYVKEHCREDEWIFLLGDNYLEEQENLRVITLPEVKRSHLRKVIFDCLTGHRLIDSLKPDYVLSLQNIATFGVKAKQAVYIHQSIPFQDIKNFSFLKSKERENAFIQYIIGFFIRASAKACRKVFVQTEWMRNAIAEKCNIPQERITVIPPCVMPPPEITPPPFSPRRFFYPTINTFYKNNETIVKACKLLYSRNIKDFTVELTLPDGTIQHPSIHCIGYLDRLELFRHYASSVLLFPSYIETVGLPLIEAASVGAPIIAADAPHSRGILSKYPNSVLFPPFDFRQLALEMENAMELPASKGGPLIIDNADEWIGITGFMYEDGTD